MLKIVEVSINTETGISILQQIYALRKRIYSSLGWVISRNRSNKLVMDEFDEVPYTTHFAILENGEVVGSHRMTKYSPEFGLPLIKEGVDPMLFGDSSLESISEATRLLIDKEKSGAGCSKQLLFNTLNYELTHNAEKIYTIGNPDHLDFFTFIGGRVVNEEIDILMDSGNDMNLVRKGTPIIVTKSTLNYNLDLNKYDSKRVIAIIKNETKPRRIRMEKILG